MLDQGSLPSWFVIQTKPRAEQFVVSQLVNDPIQTYAPKIVLSRRHGSRRWQALELLFPGYLFARFTPKEPVLHRIRRTLGVKRLLWDNETLVPLDDAIVQFILQREAGRGYLQPSIGIATGARVRFRSGPFMMLEGIVDRPTLPRDRVRVLLTLMGAPVSVLTSADILEVC